MSHNSTANNNNALFQEGVLINLCLRILNVFVIGFQFYPILLCIEFKSKSKLAYLLSSMYAWLICLYYIISNELLYCKEITTINYLSLIFENYLNKNLLIIDSDYDEDDLRSISFRIEKVMFYFILSLISMTLSIDFILLLLMEIIDLKNYKTTNTDGLIAIKYTKWKLSNHNINNNSWLNSYYCKYFKFTKQFLNINVISFVLLINCAIFIISQSSQLSQLLAILIVNILKQILNEYINNSIATIDKLITKQINDILIKSCLLTTFIYILQLFFNIKTYKTNVLKAYRGEYKLEIINNNKCSTTKLTSCSLHYPSYSIGVLLIGYFVLFYFNLFIIFLLKLCIQIRLIQLDLFKYVLPVIIMFVLKRILVFCVCRYLLFSSTKSSYVIKNFKLYLLINHFNFFFDSFIIYLGLETYDMGYMSYVGFLCIEVYQTHPIKIAFCELLLIQNVNSNTNKRKKAINKWCLAYTLIKNPSLIKYRRKLIFKQ